MTVIASSRARVLDARGRLVRAMRVFPVISLAAAGCVPQPVVSPADPARTADQAAIEQAVAECKAAAEAAGKSPTKSRAVPSVSGMATNTAVGAGAGAVGGAIAGSPGTGAAVGAASAATATVLRSAIKRPKLNPAYKKFVERCLKDRGYKVTGWE